MRAAKKCSTQSADCAAGGAVHPETGKKALYLGEKVKRFDGMTEEESQPSFQYLNAHATKPEFVYRQQWRKNDIVVWDNRCTMHQALGDFDETQRRHMERTTVLGTRRVTSLPTHNRRMKTFVMRRGRDARSLYLTSAIAADYPNRPIRIIVPFTAGGSTDVLARMIGKNLTDAWGQQVVVDNRAGANGVIAADLISKSIPTAIAC
jgi:hypothetical protein